MSSQHDADAPTGGPDRPPSWRARESLAARLRGDVEDARLRLHETVLRAEAYALLGDDQALADVGREQEALLADIEERFGRTVADAVVERDAEDVVAAAYPALDGAVVDPVATPAGDDETPRPRPRPVLSGVASAVALFGLAAAAILGVQQGPGTIEVVDAADPGPDASRTEAGVQLPAPGPGWWTVVPVDPAMGATEATGDELAEAAATDAPATTAAEPAPPATTTEPDDGDGEDAPDSPDLDSVVSDLNEAVERLDGSELGGSTPPVEDHQVPPPPSPRPTADTDPDAPTEDATEPVDVADEDGFVSGDGGQ